MSIRKAFILAAIALSAGLVGARPALAQRRPPSSPLGSLLALGSPALASPAITPAATTTSGPRGRPGASPTTPPGGVVNN